MTFSVAASYAKLRSLVDETTNDALPSPSSITKGLDSLPAHLSTDGLGEEATEAHLLSDICPGFNGPKTSSNYYGFVTGGVLPIAELADNIVTAFDQNVQVHLADQSISTFVEDRALNMLVELLNLGHGWDGRTFTTGATGSNILGLACGREAVINYRLKAAGESHGVGELGLLAACAKAGIKEIQVLTTMGHSSLYKAASVVGIGRTSVKDIPFSKTEPWRINIELLERELKREKEGVVSIVALSAGEVNTGRHATDGLSTMETIRELCDKHGAWLHADGAFGIFARSLPATDEFASLITSCSGLELVDSITGDGHKMLNVPYDCGFFLTRTPSILSSVFQNPNAAYLASGPSSIPSPLNIGLENSRRFRALPVYAVLLAYGRASLADIFARQVRLSRGIAAYLQHHQAYELLAQGADAKGDLRNTHMIVIFRAKNEVLNQELVGKINGTRKMYVSGTKWDGQPACRVAVSTWRVDVERDLELVKGVLDEIASPGS
ncbi:L-2,4-diaminobutyrate decarboxylase [Lachnellula suecica]|uniref:L-2,4-diaminobutyrate decarboxylase n=1 Tax=Lachnellula suecica TaxID=602035 RepID=A0A8T9C901_9HELO|nr:L-2,4-diaminobutyrate decarboxylase [Lachnellula suecica]